MSPAFRPHLRRFILLTLAMSVVATLTGCGIGNLDHSSPVSLSLKGIVHGGQQPISGSTVQLWTAGNTGNGSPAAPMIPSSEYYLGGSPNCTPSTNQVCYTQVISDAGGNFSLTGDYTCANASDQVYLTARNGNPGLVSGTNNTSISLITALGSCGNLATTPFVTINEVTTVAAVWALAPFLSASGSIGASATNTTGIANAFLDAQLLANPSTGYATNLTANQVVETDKLYALADIIATCINSDGSVCPVLFSAATPSGGIAPTDSVMAARTIVQNPSNNVSGIFNLLGTFVPFATSLRAAPKDWTMTLTLTGGGLSAPTALGVDSLGNVWVAGYGGVLSAFSPQGVSFTSTGYGIGHLSEVYGLTIDLHNNVWVTNEESPHHDGTAGSLSMYAGASYIYPAGTLVTYTAIDAIDYPLALATDTNGNILIADYANSSAAIYDGLNYSGFTAGYLGSGNAAFPVAISADPTHGIWLANNGDNTVTHLDASGNLLFRITCCNSANGVAVDSFGNAWVTNYYGASVTEISNSGTATPQIKGGGLSYPTGIAVDAGQNIWVANYRNTSITEIAGNANTLPAGTLISSSVGYGQDASMSLPFGINPDASGNVWVSNFGANTVTMFFGLATPTATPKTQSPTAP